MSARFLAIFSCLSILLSGNFAVAQKSALNRSAATRELLAAAWEGNEQAARNALAEGANINYLGPVVDRQGNLVRRRTTALIIVSEGGDIKLAQVLVHHGAKLDLQDEDGNTALHQAAMEGQVTMTKLLLDKGANYRLKNRYGNTPLMLDEIRDGTGTAQAYDAIARLIHRRMIRDHRLRSRPHIKIPNGV